jgi:hypothetical protein
MGAVSRKARVVGLLVVALAIPFAWLTPAAATKFPTSTTTSYKPKIHRLTGKVSSPQAFCLPNRDVTVYRLQFSKVPKKVLVGLDVTDAKGRWSVPLANAHGRFRVIVKREEFTGYHSQDRCRRTKKTIKVG